MQDIDKIKRWKGQPKEEFEAQQRHNQSCNNRETETNQGTRRQKPKP